MNKTYKIIGGVVTVLLLGGIGYAVYNQPAPSSAVEPALSTSTAATGTPSVAQQSEQTLQQLNRLQEISLGTDLFTANSFTSLKSFGINIQSQPTGRDNPFLPPERSVPANITDDPTGIAPDSGASRFEQEDLRPESGQATSSLSTTTLTATSSRSTTTTPTSTTESTSTTTDGSSATTTDQDR